MRFLGMLGFDAAGNEPAHRGGISILRPGLTRPHRIFDSLFRRTAPWAHENVRAVAKASHIESPSQEQGPLEGVD